MTGQGYRLIDHTADMGIEVRSLGPDGLFSTAAAALFDLIAAGSGRGGGMARSITVEGGDWADLMVNWLRELLYIWHADQQVLAGVDILELSDTLLRARVFFETFEPQRHEIRHEIKAVTYHQIDVGPHGGGWRARIIFDT